LPAIALGEIIRAIAISEPAAGLDLQGATMPAVMWTPGRSRTFSTHGWHADLMMVVVCPTLSRARTAR
jgi:alkylation response protein AidB-like acyl-CoA dehydrogenase